MVVGAKCATNGSTGNKGEDRRVNRTPKPHFTSFTLDFFFMIVIKLNVILECATAFEFVCFVAFIF